MTTKQTRYADRHGANPGDTIHTDYVTGTKTRLGRWTADVTPADRYQARVALPTRDTHRPYEDLEPWQITAYRNHAHAAIRAEMEANEEDPAYIRRFRTNQTPAVSYLDHNGHTFAVLTFTEK